MLGEPMPGKVADRIKSYNDRALQAKQAFQPQAPATQQLQQQQQTLVTESARTAASDAAALISSVNTSSVSRDDLTMQATTCQLPTQLGRSQAASQVLVPQTPGAKSTRIPVATNPPIAAARLAQLAPAAIQESFGRRSTQTFQSPATRRRSRAWERQIVREPVQLIAVPAPQPQGAHAQHPEHSSTVQNVVGRKACPHHKHAARETLEPEANQVNETKGGIKVENVPQTDPSMSPRAKFPRLDAKEQRVVPILGSTAQAKSERSSVGSPDLKPLDSKAESAILPAQKPTDQEQKTLEPVISAVPTAESKFEDHHSSATQHFEATQVAGSIESLQKQVCATEETNSAKQNMERPETTASQEQSIQSPLDSTRGRDVQAATSIPAPKSTETNTNPSLPPHDEKPTVEPPTNDSDRRSDPNNKTSSVQHDASSPSSSAATVSAIDHQSGTGVAIATEDPKASIAEEKVRLTPTTTVATKVDAPAVPAASRNDTGEQPPLISKPTITLRAAPAISETELSVQKDGRGKTADTGQNYAGQVTDSTSPVTEIKITGLLSHEKSIDTTAPPSIPSFYSAHNPILVERQVDNPKLVAGVSASSAAVSKYEQDMAIEMASKALDEIIIEHRAAMEDVTSRISRELTRLDAGSKEDKAAKNAAFRKQCALLSEILDLIDAAMADWSKSRIADSAPAVGEQADRYEHVRAMSPPAPPVNKPSSLHRATSTPDLSQSRSFHMNLSQQIGRAEVLPLGCANSRPYVFPLCHVTVVWAPGPRQR